MAINKSVKQQEIANRSTVPRATGRRHGPKAAGTRVGTIEDWRGGSAKSGRVSGKPGNAFRDGR